MAGFESVMICGRDVNGQPKVIGVTADGALVVSSEAPHPLQVACGTAAVAGNNTIVAAPPAGQRIVVSSFVIQNESAVATTMQLRDGAIINHYRCLGQNQGDGLALVFPVGREWFLSDSQALVLNLSGANQCGYSVAYYVEAV